MRPAAPAARRHRPAGWRADEMPRAAIRRDDAVGDLDQAVGMGRHVLVMGHQDDGVAGIGQLAQQGHDVGTGAAVEGAGRLVGEDDAAAIHQRPGDRDALLLAAGQLARPVIEPFLQTQGR